MTPTIQIAILGESRQGQFTPTLPECEVTLIGPTLTVGSGDGNGLRIDDPTVSRQHLSFDYSNGDWIISDSSSDNGTILFDDLNPFDDPDWHSKGKRVTEFTLDDQRVVLIGRVALMLTPVSTQSRAQADLATVHTA